MTLAPIFKVKSQFTNVIFFISFLPYVEPKNGYSSDLHEYMIVTGLRHVLYTVTLTYFVCRISLEIVNGFPPNLHWYIASMSKERHLHVACLLLRSLKF